MSATSSTYAVWRRLPANTFGSILFSVGMCARVPYFATILPRVRELRPGYCEVTAPKWFGVYNHIHTFHAIAACNLAETAMGMLAEATVPATHRWLPKAMSVEYTAKATSSLRAVARIDPPDFSTITAQSGGREIAVPISITDRSGVEVVHATINIWVTRA